ncbi:MAG: fasciclin domain-containing protein [Prevotellaceae bacterium]|nr:fasciclin domain-containing protein [Prevotellaceae bacterium]
MKKIINILSLFAVTSLLFISCTDKWDDHYEVKTLGDGSLWQSLTANRDLSNFVSVLEACGMKQTLESSQVFTVFAPVNASLNKEQAEGLIESYGIQKNNGVPEKENSVIKEFIKNHIALYNHSVSSLTQDSINMMNGKAIGLNCNTFADAPIAYSISCSNGIMYVISEVVDYTPNVFEYLVRDTDFSNIADFVYSFNFERFDPAQSVAGEIVDGKTVYLDSVTVLENELLEMFGKIDNEDSTYWMSVPTNKVWDRLVNEYTSYYNFDNTIAYRDSLVYTLPRIAAMMGTVFSRTNNPDKSIRDSVLSTNAVPYEMRYRTWGSYDKKYCQYDKPFDAGGVFDGAQQIVCSNGMVLKDSIWHYDKYNTFMREIVMEGEDKATLDSVDSKSTRELTYVSVATDNPYYNNVSGHGYSQVQPSGSSAPKAVFNIADVMSNVDYDVYVVAVPAVAGDTLVSVTQRVPTMFRATLYYNNQQGKQENYKTTSNFTTDPTKVDSVFIGTYSFPTASVGLSKPQVKMLIESRVSNSQEKNGTYTKTLRLDCIVFKPHRKTSSN